MDQDLFRRFSEITYAQTGISLREGKEALVSARVAKRLRALGLDSSRAYLEFLESKDSADELLQFVDAICTNFTSFFREPQHFDFLAEEVDSWVKEGQTRFRFWSAACSSGEEPYSLAITLLERCRAEQLDVKILATDLSGKILARAREGRYDGSSLRAVSEDVRRRWFERRPDGEQWTVSRAVRDLIVFRPLNLARPPFPMNGPLDVVFCRNVMIYFDVAVRRGLVGECERLLRPGGFLLTGHAETLTGVARQLSTVRPSVYCKREAP